LDDEVPEDEAQLLVSSADRGVVGDGAAPASFSWWFSVVEEKDERERLLAAQREEEVMLGFLEAEG
jgi:hypothetical protein